MKIEKIKNIFKNNFKSNIIAILIFVIFLVSFFPLFRNSGLVVFGDIDIGFYTENYIDRIFPLWNETWSTSNFFNATRIFYVGFVSIISSIFGFGAEGFQKTMIATFLFLSFYGMYLFVKQILVFEKDKKNIILPAYFIFIIAVLAALFYAFNPWSITRIQHLYLLAGYAILPFIFLKIMFITDFGRIYKYKLPLYQIVTTAILYIIAIGAVHYLVFIFLFIFSRYIFNSVLFIINKKITTLIRFNYFFILLGLIITGFLSYFLIPYLGANSIYPVAPANLNTIETINLFSRFSNLDHILHLTSYWWSMIDFESFGLGYKLGGWIIIITVFILNLFNLKNKYVSFFLLWSVILVILSSGTYSYLADFYKWLVFDAPIISSFGFILRDPNKFVGLLAFCYSVLWGLGLAYFLSMLFKIRKKIKKEKKSIKNKSKGNLERVYKRYFFISNLVYIFAISFILISIISYSFYIKPFKLVFINNFYSAVQIPDSYKKLIEYQKNDSGNGKYLYMPRYEAKLSPGYNFSITNWNPKKDERALEKAVGAIDINSSIKQTYHPLEGSTTYLPMFYDYIDEYITKGIGNNLSKYLYLLNIDKFVYHSDIVGLEEEQKKQLENLKKQKNLKLEETFGFIDIFKIKEESNYINIYGNNIFHFGGLNSLETIFSLKDYDYKKFASIFVGQDTKINNWSKYEKESDLINIKNKQDLFTSYLEEDEIIAPFNSNNYYSPFYRWSAMRTDIRDFKRHLKHLGIKNWGWDFGLNKGFIFTYSPATIDLEPYESVYDKGENIINFDKLEDISQLFVPESKFINISLEKTNKYDNLPSIKGEIQRGNSDIWRVGLMKKIEVKPANPYFFDLILSGNGVDNIHGKVQFLDENFDEIGNSYVTSPRYLETFKTVRFKGTFITPIKTKYILFKLLSLEKPNKETYWWIHNMKLNDLEKYKKDNIQKIKYSFNKKGKYKVYARVFKNIKGGEIEITIDSSKYNINTKTNSLNKFFWEEIGEYNALEIGEKDISIKNKHGFNGINVIGLMHEDKVKELEKKYKNSNLFKAKQISLFEAEEDFIVKGNIISDEINTELSNGRSVNLFNGELSTKFNILKKGNYNLLLKLNNFNEKSSLYEIDLIKDGEKINSFKEKNKKEKIDLNVGSLEIGKYELKIKVKDLSRSLINKDDLQRLDWIKIKKEDVVQPEDEKGCSYYEGLYNNKVRYLNYVNKKRIILNRGLSCFWLNTSHKKKIEVNTGEQYIFSYELEKKDTRQLHSKIKLYDKNNKHLKDIFLFNHEEFSDNKKRKFEKIITIPEGVKYFQLHFLQKQLQEFYKSSVVDISNLNVRNYHKMPGIDSVILYDNNSNLFNHNNYGIKIYLEENSKLSKKIKLKKDSAEIRVKLEPILGKNKTKINNKEIDNKNIVYYGDIKGLLSINRELNILKYSLNPYSLKLKDNTDRISEIFFLNTFKNKEEFLRFFLIDNLEFIEENQIKKLKEILSGSLEGKTIQFNEIFTKFWQIKKNDIYLEPIIINLVSNGYVLKETLTNEFKIVYIPKKYAIIGYIVSIGLLVLLVFFSVIRRKKQKK